MALSEYDRNQLIQSLEAARIKEADENTYEAKPLYQEVLRLDPENREAAFFLGVYDAVGLSRNEFGDACRETAERLKAAAGELAQEQGAAERFAPMARRTLALADKYLRALEYQEEHFTSTVRQDIQMNQRRNSRIRQACYEMLTCLAETADGISGAEQAALDARKAALTLLSEHGDTLDDRRLREEMKQLRTGVGAEDPQAFTGITARHRFSRQKFIIAGVLLGLSLVALLFTLLASVPAQIQTYQYILDTAPVSVPPQYAGSEEAYLEQVKNTLASAKATGVNIPTLIFYMVVYTGLSADLFMAVLSEFRQKDRRALILAVIFLSVHGMVFVLNLTQMLSGASSMNLLTPQIGGLSGLAAGVAALMLARKGQDTARYFSWVMLAHAALVIVMTIVSMSSLYAWMKKPYIIQSVWSVLFDLSCAVLFFNFSRKAKKKEAQ